MEGSSARRILFYSDYCEFSKNVLHFLAKHDLQNQFVAISVDRYRHRIPTIITQVPTILVGNTIYVDDQLQRYLQEEADKNKSQEVAAYYKNDMKGGYTDMFAYMDPSEADQVQRGFSSIDYQFLGANMTEADLKATTMSSGRKVDDRAIEDYEKQRQLDDQLFRGSAPAMMGRM
jgi:hypothetical protein